MSKAVLIMDMPDSCMGCNFMHIDEENGVENCQAKENVRKIDIEKEAKPDWCPLHPLPDIKMDRLNINKSFCDGWNACIDVI